MVADTQTRNKLAELENRLEKEQKLREVTRTIHALPLDQLLLKVRDDVQGLLGCERVTIYAKDPFKDEIYSKIKDGSEVKEIRVKIRPSSIAGWVAGKKKCLRIKDAYDAEEIQKIDPLLSFNKEWDQKTGFRTKQVIAVPILRDRRCYGVVQAINTQDGNPFNEMHEAHLLELSDSLAVAFQNQTRLNIRSSQFDGLLRNGVIQQETLDQAHEEARKEGYSPEHILQTKFSVPLDEISRSLSEFYRTEFIPYQQGVPIPIELLEGWTIDYLKFHLFVPLEKADGCAVLLMANPKNLQLLDDIQRKIGMPVKAKVSTREMVIDFINEFFGEKTADKSDDEGGDPGDIGETLGQMEDEFGDAVPAEQEQKDEAREDDKGIVKLVNQIIEHSYVKGASDIHIEPYMDGDCLVRLRVDGVCVEYAKLPKRFWRAVISRLKIMANLDIAERRLPQDGKIRFRDFGSKNIELRVATVPTAGGQEDIVMRILAASKPIPLDKIGMLPQNLGRFKEVVEQPYGIALCVGPTGSGKTTTLHSALGYLNEPDVKIWTAEDPVEITQQGLRQVQVQSKIGLTFERCLRAFLRLDPDIIMIGEMRDQETAEAAVEASLTGHLVFSTLHTNSASETVTRLLDLGLDPYTFGDSLLAILAQRLVRTLCSCCKKRKIKEKEWDELRKEFGYDEGFDSLGIERKEVELGEAKGCTKCNNTGYKGRMGVHELLVSDDEIRQMIYRKAKSSEIRDAAIKKGMLLLKQDGIAKVLMGKSDMREVRAVCVQ